MCIALLTQHDMAPYAANLLKQLVVLFNGHVERGAKLLAQGDDAQEDEDDMVNDPFEQGVSVLFVIRALVAGFEEKPDVYPQLEPIIAPVLMKLFDPDCYLEWREVC